MPDKDDKKSHAKAHRGEILVAKTSFIGSLEDGQEISVQKGVTRVREGHPIAQRWPELFEPIRVHYEIEDASAEPGRKRGEDQP